MGSCAVTWLFDSEMYTREIWRQNVSPFEEICRAVVCVALMVFTFCLALFFKPVQQLWLSGAERLSPDEQVEVPHQPSTPSSDVVARRLLLEEIQRNRSKALRLRALCAAGITLQKDAPVSNEILSELATHLPEVCARSSKKTFGEGTCRASTDAVKLFKSQRSRPVFSLNSCPTYIFKVDMSLRGGKLSQLQQCKMRALVAIKEHNLDRIMVPGSRLLSVAAGDQSYTVFVEKKIEGDSYGVREEATADDQKEDSSAYSCVLQQLTHFIIYTGADGIHPKNAPLVNINNKMCIALLDLEEVPEAPPNRPPFERVIRYYCWTDKQVDCVISVAHKALPSCDLDFSAIKQDRLNQLRTEDSLKEFYQQNKVSFDTGMLPLVKDNLGLNLGEILTEGFEDDRVTLGKAVTEIYDKLNGWIITSDEQTLKEKRHIAVNLQEVDSPFCLYSLMGVPSTTCRYDCSKETLKESAWLDRILETFRRKGYIFAYDVSDGVTTPLCSYCDKTIRIGTCHIQC